MCVSVWSIQRVGNCFCPPLDVPALSSFLRVFYVDNIGTLRGFYEPTQAWPITSVSVLNTLASVPIGRAWWLGLRRETHLLVRAGRGNC